MNIRLTGELLMCVAMLRGLFVKETYEVSHILADKCVPAGASHQVKMIAALGTAWIAGPAISTMTGAAALVGDTMKGARWVYKKIRSEEVEGEIVVEPLTMRKFGPVNA